MKIPFFSIFTSKIENSLQGLITTQDKIEHIKRTYDKNSEKYIASAEALLTNAKALKQRKEELEKQVQTAKYNYESLIRENKLDDAKLKYIFYKGILNSLDIVTKSYESVEVECEKARENLRNINTNKALIDTKLDVLRVQIDTMHTVNQSSSALGDFGFDCNEMIEEVEREIKNTQFKYEAKREVHELVRNKPSTVDTTSNVDLEFNEIVKTLKQG